MYRRIVLLLLISQLLLLMACTTEAFNRGAYNAVHQKECLERTGTPNCDPEYPGYDQYQKQREEATKPTP